MNTIRFFTTLLVFIFSFITFQSTSLANQIEKQAQEYRQQGYEAQQKGNLEEALSLYIKAASIGEGSPALYNDIGVIYEKLGMTDRAEEYYLKALSEDQGFLPVYSNLGYLYKDSERYEQAAEYFLKRIKMGSAEDSWTIQAKAELEQLADKVPSVKAYVLEQKAAALSQELQRQAQEEFYRNVATAKKHFEIAKELEKEGRYSRAIDEYTRALSFTPDNPEIKQARKDAELKWTKEKVDKHIKTALRLLELGDTMSAKVEIRRALSIIPDEPFQSSEYFSYK